MKSKIDPVRLAAWGALAILVIGTWAGLATCARAAPPRESLPTIPAGNVLPTALCTGAAEQLLPTGRVRTICTEWALYCPAGKVMQALPGSGVLACHSFGYDP